MCLVWDAGIGNDDFIKSSWWTGTAWCPQVRVDTSDSLISNAGPRLARGGGRVWCVWFGDPDLSDSHNSIYASCWDSAAGVWGPRMQVSPRDGFSHWFPDAWVDSAGNPGVVWVEQPHGVVYYSKFDGSQWSPALALSDTHACFVTVYDPPKIASDGVGDLHVVFSGTPLPYHGILSYVYYTKFDGTSWLTCQKLSQESAVVDGTARIAVDRPDNVWVAFARPVTGEGGDITVTHFDGESWSPEVKIDDDSSIRGVEPSVVLGQDGLPWVAWESYNANERYAIFSNRYGLEQVAEGHSRDKAGCSPELAVASPSAGPVTLTFGLRAPANVELDIFSSAGRRVRSIGKDCTAVGRNTLVWDGRDALGRLLSAGIYLCRLHVDAGRAGVVKLVLLNGT